MARGRERTIWEYHVEWFAVEESANKVGDLDLQLRALTRLDAEGWELVSVCTQPFPHQGDGTITVLYFKRLHQA